MSVLIFNKTKDSFENVSDIPKQFVIGRKYHCSWASSRGFVWKLKYYSEENDLAILITPKTKKELKTNLSSLREINKYLNTN